MGVNTQSIKKFRFSGTSQVLEVVPASQYIFDNKMSLTCFEHIEIHEHLKYHVTELDDFNSSDVGKRMQNSLISYSDKEREIILNMMLCCRRWKISECSEGGCNHDGSTYKKRTIFRCHDRYCNCGFCVMTRYAKALDRLFSLGIHCKRLYHFTMGSNRMSKKELQSAYAKYVKRMRKPTKTELRNGVIPYKMNYIKVFDIGRGSYEETGKYYNHFHTALVGEGINVSKFTARSLYVLKKINSNLNFWGIGWRYKKAIYKYFAKRVAGIYGHDGNYYYMQDVMDLREYFNVYHNAKFLTWSSPEGYLHNYAPSPEPCLCPTHQIRLIPCGFEEMTKEEIKDCMIQFPPDPPNPIILDFKALMSMPDAVTPEEKSFIDIGICGNCNKFNKNDWNSECSLMGGRHTTQGGYCSLFKMVGSPKTEFEIKKEELLKRLTNSILED